MDTPHDDSGSGTTDVPVKDAATFLLLREHESDVEVFTIRRAATMIFAGGIVAFPGGGVDASDHDSTPSTGPNPEAWAQRLGVESPRAMSIVTAAVRECFEETGLLLASPGAVPALPLLDDALASDSLAAWRRRLDAHEVSLATFLTRAALTADTSRLTELSRWVTPPGNPRRYDTFFFAVDVGTDGEVDGDSGEFDASGWARPREVLDARTRGELTLLPPTIAHLEELAGSDTIADFLGRTPDMSPIRNDLRPNYRVQ